MADIFLWTLSSSGIILAFLLHIVVGSPPPLSARGNASAEGGEADTPALYFSAGPFADDPVGSDLPALAVLSNWHPHYQLPLYRIDSAEDDHLLSDGVSGHSRAEAAKLPEHQEGIRELREVCYTSCRMPTRS